MGPRPLSLQEAAEPSCFLPGVPCQPTCNYNLYHLYQDNFDRSCGSHVVQPSSGMETALAETHRCCGAAVSSPCPPCESQEPNAGCQSWQAAVPLPH